MPKIYGIRHFCNFYVKSMQLLMEVIRKIAKFEISILLCTKLTYLPVIRWISFVKSYDGKTQSSTKPNFDELSYFLLKRKKSFARTIFQTFLAPLLFHSRVSKAIFFLNITTEISEIKEQGSLEKALIGI